MTSRPTFAYLTGKAQELNGVNILVFNPGSASLKFGLYDMTDAQMGDDAPDAATVLVHGSIEPIGTARSTLSLLTAGQQAVNEEVEAKTAPQAVEQTIGHLLAADTARARSRIDAVGCRVVHGGARFVEPTRISPTVLNELRGLQDLAPLHNPVDVAVLEQLQRSLPDTPAVAVFDTAFHRTLTPVAYSYALPLDLCARYGLRRYGFHGLSHAFVSRQLIAHLGRSAHGTKIVTCHLGNGASLCAVRDGQSVDTSMGFTPLEGLVMGTRAGDLDPGLVVFLMRTAGLTLGELDHLLNHQSGLRGLSGLSADMRDLEQAVLKGDKRARLALEVFAYRIRKYLGAYAAALEGLDAIAFTGGIGQRSASMRSRICGGLEFLGLHLDEARNQMADGLSAVSISAADSPVPIWVIPTDEEQEIARTTYRHLRKP